MAAVFPADLLGNQLIDGDAEVRLRANLGNAPLRNAAAARL
jgi:hypothetical protein